MVIAGILRVLLTSLLLASTLLGHAASAAAAPRPAALVAPNAYNAITWRSIGPFRGGRAVAVAGIPGSPNVFYFGAVAGGVWKTTDAGARGERYSTRASRLDRRDRGRAVATRRDLRRDRRRRPARRHHLGRRGVQVHRRRRRPGLGRPQGLPPDRRADRRSGESRRRAGCRDRPCLRPELRARRLPHHRRRQDLDARALSKTSKPAPSTSPSIRTTRRSSTPRCGRRAASPGISRAAAPAAGCTARPTAASLGRNSSGNGLPDGILGRIDVAVSAADSNRIYAMIEAKDGGLYRSDDGGSTGVA